MFNKALADRALAYIKEHPEGYNPIYWASDFAHHVSWFGEGDYDQDTVARDALVKLGIEYDGEPEGHPLFAATNTVEDLERIVAELAAGSDT